MALVNGDFYANLMSGGSSNDEMYGFQGNDNMDGGVGNDLLNGGLGDDFLNGGMGVDTADYSDSTGSIRVDLAAQVAYDDGLGGADQLYGFENVNGSNQNDTIAGNFYDNAIYGNGGMDTFIATEGNDFYDGGVGSGDVIDYNDQSEALSIDITSKTVDHGIYQDSFVGIESIRASIKNDVIYGGDSIVSVDGNDGDDTFHSGVANDIFYGSAGNDTMYGGAGDDRLDGGAGFDTLSYENATSGMIIDVTNGSAIGGGGTDGIIQFEHIIGSSFDDLIAGGLYDDTFDGGDGVDSLFGYDGNDIISGGSGNDILDGGAGNDTLIGGAGNDYIDGGDGGDTVSYADATAGVLVNLISTEAQNTGAGGVDRLINIEGVVGSAFADRLIASDMGSRLDGGAGDDVLVSGAENDVLIGGYGFDMVSYSMASVMIDASLARGTTFGDSQDVLRYIEGIEGSQYSDVLAGNAGRNKLLGGYGNDEIEGGAGDDFIDGGYGADIATYKNAAGAVTVDLTINRASGAEGNDTLKYIEGIEGGAYGDTLVGNAGRNSIYGGNGNDLLDGGDGNDYLNGGLGVDTVTYAKATGSVGVNLATGSSTGAAGNDTLRYIERAVGSNYADEIIGSAGGNILYGGGGNDAIDGGAGNDLIVGGGGYDALHGGTGRDIFRYFNYNEIGTTAREEIDDFTRGDDRIDLSYLDAKLGAVGNNAFTLINQASLNASNCEGAVWFSGGVLYGSNDGDIQAEFAIKLTGVTDVSSSDIIL